MLIDFPALARHWAENSALAADALFGELVSAFWRGEFESLGEDGRLATALVNRNWRTVRFPEDDHSFADKPISRAGVLRSLVIGNFMPTCGIGGRYRFDPQWHSNRHERALVDIITGDPEAVSEAFEKLATLPIERYPLSARDFINNIAIRKDAFERWRERHDRPASVGDSDKPRTAAVPSNRAFDTGDATTTVEISGTLTSANNNLKKRFEAVLNTAATLHREELSLSNRQIAQQIHNTTNAQNYSLDTIRKILDGRYKPARRLGLTGLGTFEAAQKN